jgi:hypothetical protein
LNGFVLLVGLIVSFVSVLIVGGVAAMIGFASFESPRPTPKGMVGIIAALWFGLLFLSIGLITRMRRHNALGYHAPNRVGQFFLLGLFIGSGIGALVEGACFGIATLSN